MRVDRPLRPERCFERDSERLPSWSAPHERAVDIEENQTLWAVYSGQVVIARSTFPPEMMTAVRPRESTTPESRAASAAAPLYSTTNLACVSRKRAASRIMLSSTVTTSSANRRTCSKVRSPTRTGARPSAMVSVPGSVTGPSASSAATHARGSSRLDPD